MRVLMQDGDKMQRQSEDCELQAPHARGESNAASSLEPLSSGTGAVARGRSYADLLTAERSRAGSLATMLAFLVIQLSQ